VLALRSRHVGDQRDDDGARLPEDHGVLLVAAPSLIRSRPQTSVDRDPTSSRASPFLPGSY
jgi:hypothetical protein